MIAEGGVVAYLIGAENIGLHILEYAGKPGVFITGGVGGVAVVEQVVLHQADSTCLCISVGRKHEEYPCEQDTCG